MGSKKLKSINIERRKCDVCPVYYYRRKKNNGRSYFSIVVRPSHSKTCSKKCSRILCTIKHRQNIKRLKNICPFCGGLKGKRSKRCKACFAKKKHGQLSRLASRKIV